MLKPGKEAHVPHIRQRIAKIGLAMAIAGGAIGLSGPVDAATPRPHFKPLELNELLGARSATNPFDNARFGHILSQRDIGYWQDALAAARKGNHRTARRYARRADDQVLMILLPWYEYRGKGKSADMDALRAFLDSAPELPGIGNLVAQYEQRLDDDVRPKTRISWFAKNPPRTPLGKIRYGATLLSLNKDREGTGLIREGWREGTFGQDTERDIVKRFGRYFTRTDQLERLDYLLWKGFGSSARRQMARVSPQDRQLAEARLALRLSSKGVDSKISLLTREQVQDPGFVYERTRWRRRKGRTDEAADLLLGATFAAEEQRQPAIMWRERKRLVRDLMDEHRYMDAYNIAAQNGLSSGGSFADAEWMAGWIALEYLDRPRDAARHFFKLYNGVSRPISRARAAYWLGRSGTALGRHEIAEKWYASAARYGQTIYGSLALEAMKEPRPPLMDGAITITANDLEQQFEQDPLVPLIRRLHDLEERNLVRNLFHVLLDQAERADDTGKLLQLTALAHDLARIDLALDAAKRASYREVNLVMEAYPVIDLPGVSLVPQLTGLPLEEALVYAIQRQESGFRPDATSHVGASGLMQLMPRTARSVAQELNLKYSQGALTRDPNYNALLGSAYLAQMVREFDGSYIMAVAAYNAGPHRVYRWIREFGDPRDPQIDPINWIESIPFSETRNYVQRVIEAVPIYRARLGETAPERLALSPILTLAQNPRYSTPRPSLASVRK